MVFSPALPVGGLAGLRFLDRTYDRQFDLFKQGPVLDREVADFLERAADVSTVDDLVNDRRLLKVALGAFGLEDEIDKRAFIRRILDEGTLDPGSFANRFADPRWKDFSEAMGFGNFGGNLFRTSVREEIVEQYRVRQFERAVGEIDVDIRLALNFRREIAQVAAGAAVERSGWFEIMGSRPLRSVIEGAFNLPDSFGQLDIDDQKSILEDRARRLFGGSSPAVFSEGENVERVISRFILNAQLKGGVQALSSGSTALALLGTAGLGAGAQGNLFLARLSL